MESLMDNLVDRRANKNAGLLPFPAPTYTQVRCFFGGLVRAMYRIEVVGADRLPVTGPVVIAPNHDSVLDGIVLGAVISRELRFLAKAELWRSRLLAWVLDGLGAIGIMRGHGDQLALARMRQALEAGQAVAIFPQGAIYGDRVWHRGAARMALVTGAPLLPVRLIGTARALSRGRVDFPRLRIIFGEPIKVARAQEEPVAATKLTERLRDAVESLGWLLYPRTEEKCQGGDAMFVKTLAQTKMWGVWQYMFDFCNESFSCVLGSLTGIILVFWAIVLGLGAMITRLNRRE